jgi:hypothetical protein
MRRITTKILGTCGAILMGATIASAQGPPADRSTTVTFSAPVALPGVTLPAGSYLFKLADSQVNRNVVQVFDKDRTKIFATILAIPSERNEPSDETVITFNESPANAAPAIQYWYYPGEKRGQEFAYPKSQAMALANATQKSVLSVESDASDFDSMKNAEISRVEPSAQASPDSSAQATQPPQAETTPPAAPIAEQAPATAQTPAAAPEQPARPAPEAAAQPRTTQEPSAVATSGKADTLPKTASPLPLVGFAGLLALGGACSLRILRRTRV